MMRALAIVALVAACPAPHATPPAHDDDGVHWELAKLDWSTTPPIAPRPRLLPPHVESVVLTNGLRIVIVHRPGLPIVAITTLHARAGSREDDAHAGLAALTADLLDEGAGTRDRTALATELERIGMRLDIDIATDYAATRTTVVTNQLEPAIAVLADIVRRPRFAAVDVTRVRDARVAELRAQLERPRAIAAHVFDRVVFGAHPYAQPADGMPVTLAALEVPDVVAFHARAYAPESTTIVIAGDIAAGAARPLFERAFGDWKRGSTAASGKPLPPRLPPVLAYVDTPGATSTAVMIGRSTDHEPGVADEVANSVLGGAANGRLDRKLRGELHVATAAGSNLWSGAWGGTWSIALNANTTTTAAAIRAALALADDQRTHEVADAELAAAKLGLEHELARSFETATSTAHAIERSLVRANIDYATRDDRIAAVTPAAARDAARAWQTPNIVVVGDWAKLRHDLTAIGLPVVHYSADGRVMP